MFVGYGAPALPVLKAKKTETEPIYYYKLKRKAVKQKRILSLCTDYVSL